MKRYISAILIPCVLLQVYGCYTFSGLGKDEDLNEYIADDKTIKFILNDGRAVIGKGAEFRFIKGDKFILFGSGILTDERSSDSLFCGEIKEMSIDSVKSVHVDSAEYIYCWLKDSSRISFNSNNVIYNSSVNPDSSYWVIEKCDSPELIPAVNIKKIEVAKRSVMADILGTIVFITLVVGTYAIGGETNLFGE